MRHQQRFCIEIVEAPPVYDMLNYRLTCRISFKVSGEEILTRKINKQKNRLPELKKTSAPSIQQPWESSVTMTTDSQAIIPRSQKHSKQHLCFCLGCSGVGGQHLNILRFPCFHYSKTWTVMGEQDVICVKNILQYEMIVEIKLLHIPSFFLFLFLFFFWHLSRCISSQNK